MPVLNDAVNLRFGDQQVEQVMLRGAMVWERPAVPMNTSPPVVTGAVYEGDTATTTNGTWSGGTILEYQYRWQVEDGGWSDVSGENANTYADVPVGEFRSGVRTRNAAGWSDWAYSAPFVVTEPSAGPVYVNHANNLDDSGANATASVTITGVTAGNHLIGVFHTYIDTLDSAKPGLSNPAGSAWDDDEVFSTTPVYGTDSFGSYIVVAPSVAAGSHTITLTLPGAGYFWMTLIEVNGGTGEIVAGGTAGASGGVSRPANMTATTSTNVSAGPVFFVGGAQIARNNPDANSISGDGDYTTRYNPFDQYTQVIVQTREATAPGGAPEAWNATWNSGGGGASEAWVSAVAAIR